MPGQADPSAFSSCEGSEVIYMNTDATGDSIANQLKAVADYFEY